MKVYAVEDVKAGLYQQPFSVVSNGVALRAFTDAANDERSDIGKHPEDYRLVLIGEYDEVHGLVRPVEHQVLGMATEFVKKKGDQP